MPETNVFTTQLEHQRGVYLINAYPGEVVEQQFVAIRLWERNVLMLSIILCPDNKKYPSVYLKPSALVKFNFLTQLQPHRKCIARWHWHLAYLHVLVGSVCTGKSMSRERPASLGSLWLLSAWREGSLIHAVVWMYIMFPYAGISF